MPNSEHQAKSLDLSSGAAVGGSGSKRAVHTPGPWRYLSGSHGIYASDEKAIARVYGPRGGSGIQAANARLIASAPDLLAALRKCVDRMQHQGRLDCDEELAQTIAAISKATGMPGPSTTASVI